MTSEKYLKEISKDVRVHCVCVVCMRVHVCVSERERQSNHYIRKGETYHRNAKQSN